MLKQTFAQLALRDIPVQPAVAEQRAIGVDDGHAAGLQVAQAAVLVQHDVVEIAESLTAAGDGGEFGANSSGFVRWHQVEGCPADDFQWHKTEMRDHPFGNEGIDAIGIHLPDPVGGDPGNSGKALFALPQFLLRLLALADVGQGHPQRRTRFGAFHPARAAFLRRVFKLRLKYRTIAALQGQLHAVGLTMPHDTLELPLPDIPSRRRDTGREAMLQQGFALPAQQFDSGEVDFLDDAFRRKREIADRGEFVEIKVAVT